MKSNNKKLCHFSIDDTIWIFSDLTKNTDKYKSIFDNSILRYLRFLHKKFGVRYSLYCYFEDNHGFTLADATDKFVQEFSANSSWLKFGFHARNEHYTYAQTSKFQAENDYSTCIRELSRICGSECITSCVRLSKFQGNKESIDAMQYANSGIRGLLTSDDDRGSYALNLLQEKSLLNDSMVIDGITYIHTDFRVEHIDFWMRDIRHFFDNSQIVCFTHEYYLTSKKFRIKLFILFHTLCKRGYAFYIN